MTQDRIDFSIIGFAKCGTTSLLRGVFGASPHIYMGNKRPDGIYTEMHQMAFANLSGFLSYFPSYRSDPSVLYGFKDPVALIWEPSMYHISTYFPKAKLIASVRHPIPWFQSLYNYRMSEGYWSDLDITPQNRIGECSRVIPFPPFSKYMECKSNQTCIMYQPGFGCTDWANYHVHLSRLGWTPRNSSKELTLLDHRLVNTFNFSQTKLFLMEVNQLANNETMDILIQDLESFLGMKVGSLPRSANIADDPDTTNHVDKSNVTEQMLKRMISICDDEYRALRAQLLKQAIDASEWILEFFLTSPHVYVSDRDYFIHLLKQWHVDPCD